MAQKVKEDLGFTLEMTALDSDSVTQRAATQPDSFDIADIEYWICKKVWPTGNLQAMDVSKIRRYDQIVGIFKDGKLLPCVLGGVAGQRFRHGARGVPRAALRPPRRYSQPRH